MAVATRQEVIDLTWILEKSPQVQNFCVAGHMMPLTTDNFGVAPSTKWVETNYPENGPAWWKSNCGAG